MVNKAVHNLYTLCVCMRACVRVGVCMLTQCAKSELRSCTLHAKSGLPTKSRHIQCLLLVLASKSESSSLKTQKLTITLWV